MPVITRGCSVLYTAGELAGSGEVLYCTLKPIDLGGGDRDSAVEVLQSLFGCIASALPYLLDPLTGFSDLDQADLSLDRA